MAGTRQILYTLATILVLQVSLSSQATDRVVCYYGNWAYYRANGGKCLVEDLDPFLCTHLIYSFAGIDQNTWEITALDKMLDLNEPEGLGGYRRFNNLKLQNPNLKTLIAIGGWNEGTYKFSTVAADAVKRQNFIQSVVEFVQTYHFDGADYDWEFPNSPTDKVNFAKLIQETKTEFVKYGLLLTAAVHPAKSVIDGSYDMPVLGSQLDQIHLMCYDYHGGWEEVTGHHAQLYRRAAEFGDNIYYNINFTVEYYLARGAPASKLVVGFGSYGRSFTVANSNNHGFDAPTAGVGNAGPYTGEAGFLGYVELCESNKTSPKWIVVEDPESQVPYAYKGTQWIGFDNVNSVKAKMEFAKRLGLAGGMVWSLETDDCRASCSPTKFPLVHAMKDTIFSGSPPPTLAPTTVPPPTTTPPTTAPPPPPTTTTTKAPTTTKPTTTTKAPTAGPTTAVPTQAPTTAVPTQAPTTAVPTQAPTESSGCNEAGYQRDPNNCEIFYQCDANGSKTAFTCPSGTVFDLKINACNWKSEVPECP